MDQLLKIENATLYQQSQLILQNINLEVNQGEFVYIIGKVGSGKTTIFKSIYGAHPSKSGNIFFDNTNVNKIKRNKIYLHRRKIGMIFQEFHLLEDRTVFQNLEFVLRATNWKNTQSIRNHVATTLEWCEIEHLKDKYPNELSGGEKNIVSIARAIINNPKLIIADEPTQNLDPETAEKQMQLFERINKDGTTIIMATHNYSILNKFPHTTYRCENMTLNKV